MPIVFRPPPLPERDHSSGCPASRTQPSAPRASDARSAAQARGAHVVLQHRHSGAPGSGVQAALRSWAARASGVLGLRRTHPGHLPTARARSHPRSQPRVTLTWQPCSLEFSENQREEK